MRHALFMVRQPPTAPGACILNGCRCVRLLGLAQICLYVSSSHYALAARLDRVYDESGGEQAILRLCMPSSVTHSDKSNWMELQCRWRIITFDKPGIPRL